MVRAIWRVFEEVSSEERETMVAFRWDLLSRADEKRSEFWGIPGLTRPEVVEQYSNLLAKTVGVESLTLEDVERLFTWNKVIVHDRAWIRLRGSFYGSREWKEFRLEWLAEHPACVRCGRMDGILQVHHAGLNSLDMTVMEEGFLEGLKHPERFETICRDCHEQEHLLLIMGEKMLTSTRRIDMYEESRAKRLTQECLLYCGRRAIQWLRPGTSHVCDEYCSHDKACARCKFYLEFDKGLGLTCLIMDILVSEEVSFTRAYDLARERVREVE